MERKSFVFYRSFYDGIMDLPKGKQLEFFKAICRYGLDGEEPDLTGAEMAFFRQVVAVLEGNNKKFIDGQKGGAPKGNQNAKKNKEKQPVVDLETTSGCNPNNHYIYDEDEEEDGDEDEDEDIMFGKPNDLSPAESIIRYLNLEAHRSYQFTDSNLALVEDLLRDYPPRLLEAVIRNKVAQWGGSQKMAIYLRPKTLFNRANFEQYIEEEEEQ